MGSAVSARPADTADSQQILLTHPDDRVRDAFRWEQAVVEREFGGEGDPEDAWPLERRACLLVDSLAARQASSATPTTTSQQSEFFDHLVRFFAFRQTSEEMWASLSTGAVEREPQVKPAAPPKQRATTLREVYAHAERSLERFNALVCAAACATGCDAKLAPLKSQNRASEKMNNDYANNPPPRCAYLCDVVRASIVCDTESQIVAAIQYLRVHAVVLRLKNRFAEPHFSGMRDTLINLSLRDDAGCICEVQVKQRSMQQFCKDARSHEHYEYFRSYFAGCEAAALHASFQFLKSVYESGIVEKKERKDSATCVIQGVLTTSNVKESLLSELVSTEMARCGCEDDFDRLENLGEFLETTMAATDLAFDVWVRCVSLFFEAVRKRDGHELLSAALGSTSRARAAPCVETRTLLARLGHALFRLARLVRKARIGGLTEAMLLGLLATRLCGVALAHDDSKLCEMRVEVAMCAREVELFDESVCVLKGTTALLEPMHDAGLPLANSLLACARVLAKRNLAGDLVEATALSRRALALTEAGAGDRLGHDPNEAEAVSLLASLLEGTDRREALSLYRRALETREQSRGGRHRLVSTDLNNLAAVLGALDGSRVELEEAVSLATRATAIDVSTLSERDPALARSHAFLGALLVRHARPDCAAKCFDTAVEICERALERDLAHAKTELGKALTTRAVLLRLAPVPGRDAETMLRRALQLFLLEELATGTRHRTRSPHRSSDHDDHDHDHDHDHHDDDPLRLGVRAKALRAIRSASVETLAALGAVLVDTRRFVEAEIHLRRAVRCLSGGERGGHFGNLACCLIELEKPEAREWAAKQLALDERIYGRASAIVAADFDLLATATDLDETATDEATRTGLVAIEIATEVLGPDHETTRTYAAQWGGDGDG